jgi:hypothetical protein
MMMWYLEKRGETRMYCTQCGDEVAAGSNVCRACAAPVSTRAETPVHRPTGAQPVLSRPGDSVLRQKLLEFLLNDMTSAGLSEWLRDLGLDSRGSVDEKKRRITEHGPFVRLPPSEMIREAMFELRETSSEMLSTLCADFGLPRLGTKQSLLRRLHRHISEREELLPRRSPKAPLTLDAVLPFVEWYPIYQQRDYEKEHYADFKHVMVDIFGEDAVLEQEAVAHGSSLKIDFHIGDSAGGVGVEFKMPANNSDIQKALGQVGQYQSRYGASLIVVIFPHLIDKKHELQFVRELSQRSVTHVTKRPFQWHA